MVLKKQLLWLVLELMTVTVSYKHDCHLPPASDKQSMEKSAISHSPLMSHLTTTGDLLNNHDGTDAVRWVQSHNVSFNNSFAWWRNCQSQVCLLSEEDCLHLLLFYTETTGQWLWLDRKFGISFNSENQGEVLFCCFVEDDSVQLVFIRMNYLELQQYAYLKMLAALIASDCTPFGRSEIWC